MIPSIPPKQLAALERDGERFELIDVRTPAEYREVHVQRARNVPLDRLDPAVLRQEIGGLPLYIICRSGNRARQACEKLLAAGLCDVINVEGGTQAWDAAGLPVVRGPKTISLERQVRIASGLLVVTGSALAYFVSPYWIVLPALVGSGLVFAGITDTRGRAMLLARIHRNHVNDSARAQEQRAGCGTR
jgi:rhodanese-related sulfurtransferase